MFCGSRYFKGELSSSFTMLCKDCNHHVRKSVASGFHEVLPFKVERHGAKNVIL